MKIAMWSGPRNISTAMMRAFENREDFVVVDEPFYAFFLDQTKVPHPGFEASVRSQPTDWRVVVESLVGPNPDGAEHFYQKHMTHHLLAPIDRDWMTSLSHCFLIRDPAEVVSSYARTRPDLTLDDIGFVQQTEIFDDLTQRLGRTPLVLDANDLLKAPRKMLSRLCERLEIPFSERMLSWPPGRRATDGVWAEYWYHNVEKSTGFMPYRKRTPDYPPSLQPIVDAARPHYERLAELRI